MVELDGLFQAIMSPVFRILAWQFKIGGLTWSVGEWLLACGVFGCVLWLLRWLADVNNAR